MSIKLSETQLAMMQAASSRDDRCVALSPRLTGGAAQKVVAKLIGAGLAKEVKARDGMPTWRRDADQAFALKLTAAGMRLAASGAAGGKDDRPRSSEAVDEQMKAAETGVGRKPSGDSAPRDGSKLAEVVAMLQRGEGVTIEDLTAATGWLPHTARAAMTGLRKRGYSVIRERLEGGGSAYCASRSLPKGRGRRNRPTPRRPRIGVSRRSGWRRRRPRSHGRHHNPHRLVAQRREANRKAIRATDAGFNPPPAPAALTMTYRGPLGTIEIDADPEWLRELLPDLSPRSRRGRRILRLLRLSEEHHAAMWAEREASGVGDLVRERDSIEGELEAATKEAFSLGGGHSMPDIALQAASLLAVKLSFYYDCKAAPAVLQALLEVAGAV